MSETVVLSTLRPAQTASRRPLGAAAARTGAIEPVKIGAGAGAGAGAGVEAGASVDASVTVETSGAGTNGSANASAVVVVPSVSLTGHAGAGEHLNGSYIRDGAMNGAPVFVKRCSTIPTSGTTSRSSSSSIPISSSQALDHSQKPHYLYRATDALGGKWHVTDSEAHMKEGRCYMASTTGRTDLPVGLSYMYYDAGANEWLLDEAVVCQVSEVVEGGGDMETEAASGGGGGGGGDGDGDGEGSLTLSPQLQLRGVLASPSPSASSSRSPPPPPPTPSSPKRPGPPVVETSDEDYNCVFLRGRGGSSPPRPIPMVTLRDDPVTMPRPTEGTTTEREKAVGAQSIEQFTPTKKEATPAPRAPHTGPLKSQSRTPEFALLPLELVLEPALSLSPLAVLEGRGHGGRDEDKDQGRHHVHEQDQDRAPPPSSRAQQRGKGGASRSSSKRRVRRAHICPRGHGLETFTTDVHHYSCSECETLFMAGTTLHGCRVCDFDICDECYDKQ